MRKSYECRTGVVLMSQTLPICAAIVQLSCGDQKYHAGVGRFPYDSLAVIWPLNRAMLLQLPYKCFIICINLDLLYINACVADVLVVKCRLWQGHLVLRHVTVHQKNLYLT